MTDSAGVELRSPSPAPREGRVPESMVLEIPGSAGQVWASGLRTSNPTVLVDRTLARKTANGAFKILMQDGSTEILKIKAFVPGYPTITWRDTVFFRSERVTGVAVVLLVGVAAAGAFAGFFLLPALATALLCGLAMAGALKWMSDHRSTPLARYGPVAGTIVVLVLIGGVAMALRG